MPVKWIFQQAVRRASTRMCTRPWPKAGTPRQPGPRSKRWRGRAASCCSARSDHGALLRLAGQKRKAIQYVVGNPLFALQMTQHDIRASLYAPLRVLIYENEEGKTCVEYDKPSSLFGQFGNDRITPTATMLDRKLEALVAAGVRVTLERKRHASVNADRRCPTGRRQRSPSQT